MASYEVKIKFATDRELTQDEIDDIFRAVLTQIEEPEIYGEMGMEDMDVRTLINKESLLFEKVDDRVVCFLDKDGRYLSEPYFQDDKDKVVGA